LNINHFEQARQGGTYLTVNLQNYQTLTCPDVLMSNILLDMSY